MKKILSIATSIVLCTIGANAAGTAAGLIISNSASLSYSVGGATQPEVNTLAAATFVVDKKIDFSLTHNDTPKHLITTPGANDVQREFTLKNTSNALTQDFTLSVSDLTGDIYDGKTDNKDVSNLEISIDNGGTWSAGPVTVDNLAKDASIDILVRSDIPLSNINGDVMNIQLEATAVKDGTSTAETVTGGTGGIDRKDIEDTVLAEGAGFTATGNTAFDGKYSAWAGYFIEAPVLSLTKSSCVYSDLVSGMSANAKRIPGAKITYLLDIENAGTTNASDINITDSLPVGLDFATVGVVKANDNQASCVCTNGVAGLGSNATLDVSTSPTVKITGLTATAGKHNCVTFQVDISTTEAISTPN